MKKGYWALIIIVLLIALFYFFNPLCEFNRIGSSYKPKGDCNTCNCGFFGLPMCTKIGCLSDMFPEDCVEYFDGCNTCTRYEDDEWVCTEKACTVREEPKCTKYKE